MKKVDSLVSKASRNVTESAVGTKTAGAGGQPAGHDHVDAINQLFAEFELAYHNQYHKAFAQEGSLALAKKYWLQCLAGFPPEVILRAARQVVTAQEYLPTVAAMIHACETAVNHYGLPPAHDAYVEACCAPQPKSAQDWSHLAVYLAGKRTGWFELANRTESQIFHQFETHYRQLCQRVMRGETLRVEQPALPGTTTGKLPDK